jgi:hypothetical protein
VVALVKKLNEHFKMWARAAINGEFQMQLGMKKKLIIIPDFLMAIFWLQVKQK